MPENSHHSVWWETYHEPYMEEKDAIISKIDIGVTHINSYFCVSLCGKNQLEPNTSHLHFLTSKEELYLPISVGRDKPGWKKLKTKIIFLTRSS